MNPKGLMPRHIIVKTAKVKGKKRILKEERDREIPTRESP